MVIEDASRSLNAAGRRSTASAIVLALVFILAGVVHLLRPDIYRPIMPRWLPAHDLLIMVSGVGQLIGGVGLLVPRIRRHASVGLIVLLIAIFPANVEMLHVYHRRDVSLLVEAMLWLRLPLQAFLIWWAWSVGRSGRPDRGGSSDGRGLGSRV